MVNYRFVTMAGMAGMVAALPLNINLGAYSPALVVGDGEISFGGRADVSNLMNALEGAAVNAANGAAPAQGGRPAAAPAAAAPAAPAAAAQVPAAGSLGSPAADPALQEQAQQIAALQGMGKAIAPRAEIEAEEDADDETSEVAKRDLAGFDRALRYAEAALTKGPKIQLGTGEGGAGVGIIVDNNPTAAARPGKGEGGAAEGGAGREGKAKRKARRDLTGAGQKVKVTTMYVRSGIPASLQNSPEVAARSVPAVAPAAVAAPKLSSRSDALDAVNLNVDGDKGLTMTFVETINDPADDE